MFVLDPAVGAFLRVENDLKIPESGKVYSANEGNRLGFARGYQDYVDWAQRNGYSARYVGAMVADVHRTLLKGGVFLYPPTAKSTASSNASDRPTQTTETAGTLLALFPGGVPSVALVTPLA